MFIKSHLITRLQLLEWAVFALVAFAFCLLLALRPIPSEKSANDTVRYVSGLHQYCGNALSDSGLINKQINKEISYQIFYSTVSPACWADSDGIFLFEVAAFLPLMFLLFSPWRNGTVLWACSLMFSVYGLELMTNAMRQGLAMLLFFGALSLIQKRPRWALLLGALAVAAHTSVLAFLPMLLWMARHRLSRKWQRIGIALMLFLTLIGGALYGGAIAKLLAGLSELRDFYMAIYVEQLSFAFILFMTLPLFYVYSLRYLFERASMTSAERIAIVYSSMLVLVSLIIFPAISYRFAIFAVPLQIFLVSLSGRHSMKIGGFALIGMIIHMSIMLSISKNYAVLING